MNLFNNTSYIVHEEEITSQVLHNNCVHEKGVTIASEHQKLKGRGTCQDGSGLRNVVARQDGACCNVVLW